MADTVRACGVGVVCTLLVGVSLAAARAPAGRLAPAAAGDGRGLRAELYAGGAFEKRVGERIDPEIDFVWGHGTPGDGLEPDWFSIRWTGWIKAPRKGKYKLVSFGDDGTRLWLDGKLTLDRWDRHGRSDALITLTDRPHPIKIEHRETKGWSSLTLHWVDMKTGIESVVPAECFFHDEAVAEKAKVRPQEPPRGTGLLAEFFTGNFRKKLGSRKDARLCWFGEGSAPVPGMPVDHFQVRWTTWLKAPRPGRYRLVVHHDDGARVWFDGKPVIDHWRRGSFRTEVVLDLTDRAHALKVEYYEDYGPAHISLSWQALDGSFKEQPIPPGAFFTDRKKAEGKTR